MRARQLGEELEDGGGWNFETGRPSSRENGRKS
jgi:hypothetical protein